MNRLKPKNKLAKLLSVLLAATLAFQSAGITASASTDAPSYDLERAGIEDGTDVTGSADGEDTGEAPSAPPNQDWSSLFPGLPETYIFSDEQLHNKQILSEHTDSIALYEQKDNTDLYAEGEIVYLAESAEDADLVAAAFGATLDSYALGVAVISLPEDRTVSQAVLAAADSEALLPAVWPNYYATLTAAYTDPALSDASADYQWQHEYVGSRYAWDAGYTGKGVKVGVIDSGILNSHEEFGGRLVSHLSMLEESTLASSSDINGHGTHVSGIVAASLNGKGGAGIAPEASLYVYDVTDANGVLTSAATLRAINRAVLDGVDILNMSFGSPGYDGNQDAALQKAYQSGIALFASAGNDSTNGVSFPAAFDNVYSIASLQQDGRLSYFSNYGDVDLSFPGSNIYSTVRDGSSSYGYKSGTSMACPVAAGVAAVILSGAADVKELSDKPQKGTARVDALYSVMRRNTIKCASSGTGAGTTYLPKVFNLTIDSANAVPAMPKFDLKSNQTFTSTTTKLTVTCASKQGVRIYYSTDGKTPALKDGQVVNGKPLANPGVIDIGGAKKVTVKAIAVNLSTGKASKAATATYNFAPNPSKLTITSANGVNRLAPGTSLALKASAEPSYAVPFNVKWSVAPEGKGLSISSSGKLSVAKTATEEKSAIYSVTAIAVNKKTGEAYAGATATWHFTVITPDSAVKTVQLGKPRSISVGGESANLAGALTVTYANGEKGSAKDVVWSSSNTKIATVSTDGVVTAVAPGKADIRATANDGSGKSAACKITVIQPATQLKLSGSDKLAPGKSITLTASFKPDNVSSKALAWEVTGTGVTVKNGKVTASKTASGTYTVKATTQDGSAKSATHEIKIVADPIQSISLPKNLALFTTAGNYNAPTQQTLSPVIKGGDAKAVTFTSSAPGVASVDSTTGKVTALASGKAKITCAATDGSNKKAVCNVTVSVPMSRLTIVPTQSNGGYVSVGCTLKLQAVIGNSYGKPQNTKVTWSVPEAYKDIISISSSGVVKVKSLGDATTKDVSVRAEAADGSGAYATYQFTAIRKIKSFTLSRIGAVFYPTVKLDNGKSVNLPYTTNISTKGIGLYKGSTIFGQGFQLLPEKPTTKKTSASKIYVSDCIKVNVTVTLQTGNKKASSSIYLGKTADGQYYYY